MSYACIRQGEHQGEDQGDQRNNICRGERVGNRDRGGVRGTREGTGDGNRGRGRGGDCLPGFRRIRQCTGVTLLTVNRSPREHITVLITAKNARGPS